MRGAASSVGIADIQNADELDGQILQRQKWGAFRRLIFVFGWILEESREKWEGIEKV